MDRQSLNPHFKGILAAMAAVVALWILQADAQVPVDANGKPISSAAELDATSPAAAADDAPVILDAAQLAELVGPVALYPDDLLAIVLPASTYPLEIVQAARFLERLKQDSSLKPNEEWDESITALLNYPEVVQMMDRDIDWTWKLGEAVVNQQPDVIAAVESFRDRAYAAGNLQTDQHQTVTNKGDGIIEIVPVNEEIIYVPYYEPERVLVRQVTPVYYYYPRPYPVYYYPYPADYAFYDGYFWGVTTAFGIGWSNHYLHVHHLSYWGHPYYGRSYYGNYYRQPSVNIYNSWYVNNSNYRSSNRYRDGDRWRPRHDVGARPGYYSRTRSYRDNDVRSNNLISTRGNAAASSASSSRGSVSDRSASLRTGRTVDSDRQRNVRDQGLAERRQAQPSADQPIRFRERNANAATGSETSRTREQNPNVATGDTSGRVPERDLNRNAVRPSAPEPIRFRERTDSRDTLRAPATSAARPGRAGTVLASNTRGATTPDNDARIVFRDRTATEATSNRAAQTPMNLTGGVVRGTARAPLSRATALPRTSAPRSEAMVSRPATVYRDSGQAQLRSGFASVPQRQPGPAVAESPRGSARGVVTSRNVAPQPSRESRPASRPAQASSRERSPPQRNSRDR
jgi:hypothetical protein